MDYTSPITLSSRKLLLGISMFQNVMIKARKISVAHVQPEWSVDEYEIALTSLALAAKVYPVATVA